MKAASYVGTPPYSMLNEQKAEDIMPLYISQPHCDFSIARGAFLIIIVLVPLVKVSVAMVFC